MVDFHRQDSERQETENERLKERLERMEHTASGDMAAIPRSELVAMRTKVADAEEREKLVLQLREREKGLKEDLENVREGKVGVD